MIACGLAATSGWNSTCANLGMRSRLQARWRTMQPSASRPFSDRPLRRITMIPFYRVSFNFTFLVWKWPFLGSPPLFSHSWVPQMCLGRRWYKLSLLQAWRALSQEDLLPCVALQQSSRKSHGRAVIVVRQGPWRSYGFSFSTEFKT